MIVQQKKAGVEIVLPLFRGTKDIQLRSSAN